MGEDCKEYCSFMFLVYLVTLPCLSYPAPMHLHGLISNYFSRVVLRMDRGTETENYHQYYRELSSLPPPSNKVCERMTFMSTAILKCGNNKRSVLGCSIEERKSSDHNDVQLPPAPPNSSFCTQRSRGPINSRLRMQPPLPIVLGTVVFLAVLVLHILSGI